MRVSISTAHYANCANYACFYDYANYGFTRIARIMWVKRIARIMWVMRITRMAHWRSPFATNHAWGFLADFCLYYFRFYKNGKYYSDSVTMKNADLWAAVFVSINNFAYWTKSIWFGRVPNVNIVSLSVETLRWCPHFYFEIVTLNLVKKLKDWKEWGYNQVPHSCSLLPYIYYLERPKCCHANIYQGGKVLFRFILMIGWECSSTLLGFAEGVCGRDGSTFTSALLDEVGNGQEEGSGDALRRR